MLLLGLALFASGEGFVKHLIRDYNVAQVVWGRFTFHALVFLVIFARGGILAQMRTARPGLQISRSILLLIATGLFFTAVRYLPLADAVAINFVAPLLVTAFAIPVLKEHVGMRRWIAILVGFIGVLVIIRPGFAVIHWAAFLPLGTAVCYAFYQLLTRIAARTDDARTSLFWTAAVGAVVTSMIAPFAWTAPDAAGWAMMITTGFLFGLGHYLLIRALEVAPASVLSPFIYTHLIWATVVGYLVFDDFPDAFTIAGGAIVITSGLYVWHRETLRTAGNSH
jgi:drug/metabolite transporter (DMT)-like permease